MSNKGDYWETPPELFKKLDDEFAFELDAAANFDNAKCLAYFNEEDNSLDQDWSGYTSIWLNPPYSRGNIEKFMEKAYRESQKGCTVVCLVRFDPSTQWFQDWVDDFPCCVVIYNPNYSEYEFITDYYIWDWKE
jgi:site-specific DNA-methyltransferase (adenine-specific)